MNKTAQIICAFVFGVLFLSIILGIVIFIPYPTPIQFFTFRVILALAAGGVAAMIPGFIQVAVPKYVRAGGAIAAFVIVYFFNPASVSVQGQPTSVEGLFVKKLTEEKGLVEYYWKQANLRFRFPADHWTISDKAASAGLGDITLIHTSGKDAQMQLHVSLLDDKYRENWTGFRNNIVDLWRGTIEQFGPFSTSDIYLDGRRSFEIQGHLKGESQGMKVVDLVYAPLGDNRLFEIHLTRNQNHAEETELVSAFNLVKSTIQFER